MSLIVWEHLFSVILFNFSLYLYFSSISLSKTHTHTQPAARNMAVLSSLQLDGESVYSLVSNPLLLLLTRVIFVNCGAKLETLQVRYNHFYTTAGEFTMIGNTRWHTNTVQHQDTITWQSLCGKLMLVTRVFCSLNSLEQLLNTPICVLVIRSHLFLILHSYVCSHYSMLICALLRETMKNYEAVKNKS